MPNSTMYEICVQDILQENWASYFSPFELTVLENRTILAGRIHDQSELFGVLLKIRDMGLRLISVNAKILTIGDGFQRTKSSIMIM